MEVTTEEVFAVLDKLLENLGLQLEEYDFVFLTQAELYVEMFKLMFPTLGPMLDVDFSQEDIDDEELIQSLLDFLSQYIIKVDLDHISSSLITQGDPKHILNFLQLIYEISKMVIAKEGEGEEEEAAQSEPSEKVVVGDKLIKSSPNSLKQLSEHSQRSSIGEWQAVKYHTAQGIPEEFIDMIAEEEQQNAEIAHHPQADYGGHAVHPAVTKQGREYRKQPDGYDNPYRQRTDSQRDSYSGSRISEVSKSKEFSDYELNTKKKSALGRRSEEPTSEDFERLRNYDAHKRNKQEAEPEEEPEEDYGDEDEDEVEEEEEREGEEEELQDMPEDESDRYVSIRERSHQNQKIHSHLEGGEIEHEQDDEEQEGEEGEYEYVYEDEYGNLHRHIPGQEEVENEDAEYYASDPIDYNSIKAKGKAAPAEQQHEEEEEEEEEEEPEEAEQGEYEYQYGQEEPQSGVEEQESHVESEDHQLEPNYVQQQEIERQNYYYEQAKKAAKKSKAKAKKARPQTAKTQTRPVTAQTFKKPEVKYRPLRPVTGNFVPPQTKKSGTQKKTTQSTDKKPTKKSFVQRDSENQSERSNTENMHPKYQTHSRNSQNKSSRKTSHAEEQQQQIYRHSQDQSARKQLAMRYSQVRKPVKVVKPVRIKGETLTSAFEAQQSMLYDRIRDEKLDYLKKIHKIIFQLDKKRVLEERKAYMDYRRSIDEDMIGMMLTMKQNYKDKIDNLKRGHLNDRNERKMTDLTQKMFIQTLKQELNLDQMREIERLRSRWSNEKLRFEMMTQDENFLEKRLVDLYKK